MIYKLNKSGNKAEYTKVKRVSLADFGWKEEDLEKLISNNIQDFISSSDLMTIFTERKRQEEPDILAVDKKGDLYIFELKRWEGKQENLLQVLRYGQLFGRSNYDDLSEIYKKYQKSEGAELEQDHSRYFFDGNSKLDRDNFNLKQHFLIVTNGLDQETVESIIYWKNNGLSIDAIIYWVFEIGGEFYIEFNTYSQVEDYLEYENNYYIVNTNIASNPQYTDDMLNNQKVAAYYPGWREKIKKLQKGDTVFLYKSGEGIIAYGNANGNLEKAPCDGFDDYEYFMKLNNFEILDVAISAAELKEIAECGFNFRQTMFSISTDAANRIIKYIKSKK